MLRVRRVYDPAGPDDGHRVLVDRLWPRGLSKEAARLDAWLPDLAPSHDLRRRFGHDPARWAEFRDRYRAELQAPTRQAHLQTLARRTRQGTVTLLYAARDEQHNNAVVLRDVLLHLVGPADGRASPPE